MKQRKSIGVLCAAVLVLAAGCGGGGSSGSSSGGSGGSGGGAPASGTQDQHRGGTLTMLWNGAGTSIDTALDYDQNWQILTMTSDGLLNYRRVAGARGTELVPDLAESIPPATDGGRTYQFKLRPGIRFSNGKTVAPSDFTYTMERQFKAAAPASGFYQGLVGGDACAKTPKRCDLSKGVVADDAGGTVTFHLTEPDPDFLQKLAIPFAYVVPKGTPNKDTGTKPLPATGPYMIQSYTPDQQIVFVRNPNFKEWSHEAQPDGYPDKILMKLGLSVSDAVTQIQNGQADWSYDPPPADRLGELGQKYQDQIHINPNPQMWHMALNTRVAPFDKLAVRQALNFATDRNAVLQLWGGKALGQVTCQVLPPNFPGHVDYCPYTASPGAKWSAPDMAKAQQLIDASGTKGQKVTVISTPDETSKAISLYFVSLLRKLGYDAGLKTLNSSVQYSYVQDSRNKAQISLSYWYPDYTSASNFMTTIVGCEGFHPASTSSPNLSEFCDKDIQAKTDQALKLAQTDPDGANKLWAEVDKETTDQAPLVALFVSNRLDFVSKRLGNYQFNASVTGNFMIDQAWVK
jgi:peptide/nickel transport system substrate-binding protein